MDEPLVDFVIFLTFDFPSQNAIPKAFFDYELFAVNIHSGGVGGGHYYAYCKVDNEWYCFNDSSVNKSSYLGEQAYVLLYKQKNPFVTETHTMK